MQRLEKSDYIRNSARLFLSKGMGLLRFVALGRRIILAPAAFFAQNMKSHTHE